MGYFKAFLRFPNRHLLQTKIFLNLCNQAATNFLATVIGKDRSLTVQCHFEMASFGRFKHGALLGKPSSEFALFHWTLRPVKVIKFDN